MAMTVVSAWAIGQGLNPAQRKARAQTEENVKQCGLATMLYTVDNDDRFPAAKSMRQLREQVAPYLRQRASMWESKNPGSKVLFNFNLAEVEMGSIKPSDRVPMYYESKAWPDGARVYFELRGNFRDAKARTVQQNEWPAIAKGLKKKWK